MVDWKNKWDSLGKAKWAIPMYATARGGKYLAERTGIIDTEEEKQLARELEEDKARLREQAKSGVTPELRKFARQAAQARAALGSRFSDRRLSPEQRARMLGNAQSDLSGKTAAGGAELMRSGREIAEQNLRAINEKRRAEINAQQAQMMNAALNVASMGAGLMAGPTAPAATNALTQYVAPQQQQQQQQQQYQQFSNDPYNPPSRGLTVPENYVTTYPERDEL